jgi:DNA-binding LacI/PurR family transcriptional regulator
MDINKEEMGKRAVRSLFDRLAHPECRFEKVFLSCEMTIRASTQPIGQL